MANRRMFSRDITDSDPFLDLPLSAQALYFHLGMSADDEGFVSSAKRTARSIGAGESDLSSLVDSGFLIPFPESGVYVITHFLINNTIRSDRAKKTTYQVEVGRLKKSPNGFYTLGCQDDNHMPTECQPIDNQPLADGGIGQSVQSDYSIDMSINSVKAQLAAEGWTMTDIETAVNRCRGKVIKRDLLQYVRKILENLKNERPVTIPTVGQDFNQRSYDGVDDEIMANLAKEMAAFNAQGAVSG